MSLTSVAFMGQFFDFMTSIAGMLFVLAIVWMVFRRPRRHGGEGTLSDQEQAALEELTRLAGKMDQRLATLEKILDAEDPKWRDRAA